MHHGLNSCKRSIKDRCKEEQGWSDTVFILVSLAHSQKEGLGESSFPIRVTKKRKRFLLVPWLTSTACPHNTLFRHGLLCSKSLDFGQGFRSDAFADTLSIHLQC